MTQLQDFLKQTTKQFGEGVAIIVDEKTKVKVDVCPTGIDVVDKATGIGGFPRGRVSEVFGREGCGKTTLCLHAIAEAQKRGENCAFIDMEQAISFQRMEQIGVDMKKLVFSQPDSGEQALELVEMMVKSSQFSMIVVDSVAALVPMVEVEKDMGDSVMGVQARLLSQAMRKLAHPVNKHNVALVFTNQVRAKLGGYVVGETTPGGMAIPFYSSLRIRMRVIGAIKNGDNEQIGSKFKMTVIKNKQALAWKEAEFEIGEHGIDADGSFIDELVEKGVLVKTGSWFALDGKNIANGKISMMARLKEEPELRAQLVQALHKAEEPTP